MNHLFRFLLLSLLLPLTAVAQQPGAQLPDHATTPSAVGQLRPLTADPTRAERPAAFRVAASAARRTASLATLPFLDDFANTRFGPRPDPVRWDTTSGAFRNDTFSKEPPTRGTLTFDGLDRYGRAYSGASAGETDTLASRAIDLSGRTDVVLSFWWQAGGLGRYVSPPTAASSFALDFDDGSGFWDVAIWQVQGTNTTTDFQQVFVVVPALYCTAGFRFRFRSTGARQGGYDFWSLDYVLLDANRQPQPGPVRDVAFSQPLGSPLRRFTAMPVWQFNAAASATAELADSIATTFNNLEPNAAAPPTPLTVEGYFTARDVGAGGNLLTSGFLNQPRAVPAGSLQERLRAPLQAALPGTAVALSSSYKLLTTELRLSSGEPTAATLYNDTLRRSAHLGVYYAHDDGSAELEFGFRNNTDPIAAAVGFDLNTPDYVAGVELYLGGDMPAGARLFMDVWADNPLLPGTPALTPLAHVGFLVPPDSLLRRTHRWWAVYFPQVAVSGRFYVGYSQPANAGSGFRNIGFDASDTLATKGLFFIRPRAESWIRQRYQGALMVRAHLTNNVLGLPGASAPTPDAAALHVYPNPVSATFAGAVTLPTGRTGATLFDALGRAVRTAPAGATTLDVRGLPPGVYVLRLGNSAVRLLITE